jgi:hypothetical protein
MGMVMKHFLVLFVFLLAFNSVSAFQDQEFRWGHVASGEWEVTSFPGDEDAHSIILFDIGESYIDLNLNVIHTRHKRIKILDTENSDYTDIRIPVYNDRDVQRLQRVRAQTINLSGSGSEEITEVGRREFYSETSGDFEITTFAFPAVQDGSIVEYRVEMTFGSPVSVPDWDFQHSSPVLHSEYRVMVPDFLDYRVYTYGYESFESGDLGPDARRNMQRYNNAARGHGQNTFWQLVLKDAPAVRSEPYITSLVNYRNRVRFSLRGYTDQTMRVHNFMHTWEEIAERLDRSGNFGRELSARRAVRREVDEIIDGLNGELEIAHTLYKTVARDIQWDGRHRIFTSGRNSDILDEKTGSSSDKAILLISMLREAGLEANPVLVSTRQNGRVDWAYPSLSSFNHVLVMVQADGQDYLLDPIDAMIPFGMLYPSSINGAGLLVDNRNYRIIDIYPAIGSSSQTRAVLSLNEDGSLSGQFQTTFSGYEAIIHRMLAEKEGKDPYLEKELLKYLPDSRVAEAAFLNLDEPEEPFQMNLTIENDRYGAVAGDMIYINPFITDRLDENPFITPVRNFPVEFNFRVAQVVYSYHSYSGRLRGG